MRIMSAFSLADPQTHAAKAFELFDGLGPMPQARRATTQAPVLIIPGIFEPNFCSALIEGHEREGGKESGFMIERDGKTVEKKDHIFKRRSDWTIADDKLKAACRARMLRRIVPEVHRAFQFHALWIERYLVACYESDNRGHFSAHRDNTTKGTAHRRFAVSINLNQDYEGGYLVFPEFGRTHYRPPLGGACVFSCSLIHEATPVTMGKRYVFVPFLYDEAAKTIRDENAAYLEGQG